MKYEGLIPFSDDRRIFLYDKEAEIITDPRLYDKCIPLSQKLSRKYDWLIISAGEVLARYKTGRERILSEKQIVREHIPSFGDLYYR